MAKDVIILLGLKHSGKSTLGKRLAKALGYTFYDTDYCIEEEIGMSVRDLYNQKGAGAFLKAEEDICKKLSENPDEVNMIISTGGGICDNAPALNHLKTSGRFVFLKNNLDSSVFRVMKKISTDENGNFTGVPAFIRSQNPETLDDIKKMLCAKFKERAELYEKISDVIVVLPEASIEDNVERLLNAVKKS